jgi:hypothetical protein
VSNKFIIGFTGAVYANNKFVMNSNAGKDFILNSLCISFILKYSLSEFNFIQASFAEKLKQMCCIKYGLDIVIFEDRELKEEYLPDIRINGEVVTPRDILKIEGTEYGRDLISQSIWVDRFKESLAELEIPNIPSLIFINDVRFENEVEYIKENGIIVDINRNINENQIPENVKMKHKSNRNLSEIIEPDITFYNDIDFNDNSGGYSNKITQLRDVIINMDSFFNVH